MQCRINQLEERLENFHLDEDNVCVVDPQNDDYLCDKDSLPVCSTCDVSDKLFSSAQMNDDELVSAADAARMFSSMSHQDLQAIARYGLEERPSRNSTAVGLSPHLQADMDRYLQKVRYIKDKEKLEKLEQEKYELELEKRRLRASKNGREFTNMMDRQVRASELRKAREERRHKKEKVGDNFFPENHNKEIAPNASYRHTLKDSRSWDEIQKDDEIRRRDRIEKRKQQLSNSSVYPSSSIILSVKKWTSKDKDVEIKATNATFKPSRKSPTEICAQLRRCQQTWDLHLRKEKELQNLRRKPTQPVQSAINMENRHKLYEEKRKQKQMEKEKRDMEAKRSADVALKNHRKRIMKHKMPETSQRLTKASEKRAKTVRDSFEKSRKSEMEESKREIDRIRRSREISSYLTTLVNVKDIAITERARNEQTKQRIEENTKAFKERKRANQERIAACLKQRPSLIERHDMSMATATASRSALMKVANIVDPCSRHQSNEGDLLNEMFDTDEKIQLGVKE